LRPPTYTLPLYTAGEDSTLEPTDWCHNTLLVAASNAQTTPPPVTAYTTVSFRFSL
jgi:hypothetical protein